MKFKINPGEFRHPIKIEYFTYEKDIDYINKKVWKVKLSTKAKILNVRGDEFLQAQGTGLKIEKTFYIRANKSIILSEEDRIIYNNTPYEIVYINNIIERNLYLEIKCKRFK